MSSFRLFVHDLARAAGAWRAAPALPIASVLLMLAIEPRNVFPGLSAGYSTLLGLPFALFGLGWVGTQRIWYQRIFERTTLSAGEVWNLSWHFFGRYAVLGAAVFTPIWFAVGFVYLHARSSSPMTARPGWLPAFLVLYLFALDVVLTFVVPALAFTTPRVSGAWRIGLKMLRSTWPACAVYALAPPLTLAGVSAVNPANFPFAMTVLALVVSALVGLVTKGAIASFYLEWMRAGAVGVGPRR